MSRFLVAIAGLISLVVAVVPSSGGAVSQGTALTYQGELLVNANRATVTYEADMGLYDAAVGGNQVGPLLSPTLSVVDGLFTEELDFGPVFDGRALWLEITIKPGGGLPPVTLSPRQRVTPAPSAQFAEQADRAARGEFSADTVRVSNPNPGASSRVIFGPTDDCTIGIDPALPGLTETDPTGFRLLGPGGQGCRLIFGPTMDCTVEVNAALSSGLLLRDPRGIRILDPSGGGQPALMFGPGFDPDPDNNCAIVLSPTESGLVVRDDNGLRISNIGSSGKDGVHTLRFGPTDDCSISADPNNLSGLLLRDPSGIRVLDPSGAGRPALIWGSGFDPDPDNNCAIVLSPTESGLVVRDDNGLRISNIGSSGQDGVHTLRFGPTDDCSISADPNNLSGLLLRDPSGIRILDPSAADTPRVIFGGDPDDLCVIVRDPGPQGGLRVNDPGGLTVSNIGSSGKDGVSQLSFGTGGECRIFADPDPMAPSGLTVSDPGGLRVRNIGSSGKDGVSSLLFGPTDLCRIEADPNEPGLIVYEADGVWLRDPTGAAQPRLIFGDGPDDLCRIGLDPTRSGLVVNDPAGLRVSNIGSSGKDGVSSVKFGGPTDDCRIDVDPNDIRGLQLRDPRGVAIVTEDLATGVAGGLLTFGENAECSIRVNPPGVGLPGLCLTDPSGFKFIGGFVAMGVPQPTVRLELPTTPGPDGTAIAGQWVDASSRRWKENIRPIDDPLEKLAELQGVYYDWRADHGAKPGVGFIAEEVGQVFPELVVWEENGIDAKGVSYDHLVAVAVEGIKAQQSQLDALTTQNADMEAHLRNLESENAELRDQLHQLQAQMAAIAARLDQRRGTENR